MLKGKPLSNGNNFIVYSLTVLLLEKLASEILDSQTLKDYSIEPGTKLNLIIKKDTESNLTKQLKVFGKSLVTDVDEFAIVFNKVSF
jgi:hypothetical protein